MSKLLFIKASPRKSSSKSITIAEEFLSGFQESQMDLKIDTLDLWDEHLPPFDGDKAAAKMKVITQQSLDDVEKTSWNEVLTIIARFKAADYYLFAVPMWNGGIPYRLKQYVDIIHQPGELWSLDPVKGYEGLLKGKKAIIVYTSGAYAPGVSAEFGDDFQSTYLRSWLNQAGILDLQEIRYQPTLLTSDPEGALETAKKYARNLGLGKVHAH